MPIFHGSAIPSGASAVEISHTDTYGQGGFSANTTITITGMDIGTATSDRLVIGAFGCSGGPPNTASAGATIGGNAATLITEQNGGDATIASIYKYNLTSGTTATFTISYANGIGHMTFNAFAIYNANHTQTDSFSSIAEPGTGTLDIAAGGCALSNVVSVSSGGSTYSWTGLTELMEDATVSGYPTLSYSAAMDTFDAEQTGRTIEVDRSAGSSWNSMSAVSFEPA